MDADKRSESSVISDVLRQGGRRKRVGPILVNFGHAKLNPDVIADFESPEVSYEFKSFNKNDEVKVGAVPKLDVNLCLNEINYSSEAPSVKQLNNARQFQTTFLAVRNKKTKRIKLIEANTITLGAKTKPPPTSNSVLIEEEMKRNEEEMRKKEGLDEDKLKSENRLAMNKKLVGEFGQKKGKRMYEQNDRMKVDSELLNDKLNHAAMTVDDSSLETLNTSKNDSPATLTPPCNRDATFKEQVYTLENGILNQDEQSKLRTAAAALLEQYSTVSQIKTGIQNKKFSDFFGKILIRELINSDHQALAIAIYMEAIINFISLRARELNKGARGMQDFVPFEIRQKVFNLFTNDQNSIVPTTRDSAICYVIVLSLMVNKYCVEFSDLTSSIRVKAEQLKKLVKVTGARFQTDIPTQKTFVILRIPLDFFDPSATLRKAKRKTM